MDLEAYEPRPELERPWYFKLSYEQLEVLDDAESRFERGIRFVHAIGVEHSLQKGKDLIASAAKMGHPVAMAYVEEYVRHEENPFATEDTGLYSGSLSRGHPYG